MAWSDGLTDEQRAVVGYDSEKSIRILAGPGTGKTKCLIHRVAYLQDEKTAKNLDIVVITFTRFAAREIRERLINDLKLLEDNTPTARTLHSYALSMMMQRPIFNDIERPLRIADDYEENKIIIPELAKILRTNSTIVKEWLKEYDAAWNTLSIDNPDWREAKRNIEFEEKLEILRQFYGFMLRGELPYKFKDMLEGEPIIAREIAPLYLLVDEYQDLNRCDQAVIYALSEAGSRVFIAGDDDQSVYVTLRHAHPEGIRRFPERFVPCEPFKLELCIRCPRKVIDAANTLIKNDRDREDKNLIPRPDTPEGGVHVLNFSGPRREAVGIVNICKGLHIHHNYNWSDILILLSRKGLGKLIAEELDKSKIPFVNVENKNPLDDSAVRLSYSELRLVSNEYDALALRTWFNLQTGIGGSAVEALRELCSENSVTLLEGVRRLSLREYKLSRFENKIISAWQRLADRLEKLKEVQDELLTLVELLFGADHDSNLAMEETYKFLTRLIQEKTVKNIDGMITMLQTIEFEQEHTDEDLQDAVRLMTMYKAKGLEAPVVIVPGLENDLMPGSEDVEAINEIRRLLYVSITRSKEILILTHCTYRVGPGAYMGTGGGEKRKKRSDFLKEMGFNRSRLADDTNTGHFRDTGEWL